MRIDRTASVKMRWDTFTFPIKVGTPINQNGVLANDGSALGIVPETIRRKPDTDGYAYIMTGGQIDLSEIGYTSLSAAAMRNMNGIMFFGGDGTPSVDPVYDQYELPAATTDAIGGVKMAENVAEAAGEAPTAAEFKALLDALIEAGIMEEAPET